jgi:hypothetical protein
MDKYLFSYATASDSPFKRRLIRLVEKATGQPTLKRMYVPKAPLSGAIRKHPKTPANPGR